MKTVMAITLIFAVILNGIYMRWFQKTGDTSWKHALQHAVSEVKSIFK